MLTSILFGQARSGAADPAGAKATQSPTRQQSTRSFSDHVDDRARRREANSVSDKDRADQPEKQTEKAADSKTVEAGTKPAAQKPVVAAQSDGGPQVDDAVALPFDSELTGLADDSAEVPVIPAEAAEGTDLPAADADLTAEDADLTAEDTVELGLVALGDTQQKPVGTKSGDSPESVARVQNIAAEPTAQTAQTAVTAEDGVEIASQVAATVRAEPQGSKTQNTVVAAQVQGASQAAGQTSATKVAVEATVPASADSPKVGDVDLSATERQASMGTTQAAQRVQDGVNWQVQTGAGAAKSAVPLAAGAAGKEGVAQAVPGPAVDTDPATQAAAVDASGKSAGSKSLGLAETLAAVGQPRAVAASDPGRRAQGRAHESREAQATVSGNAVTGAATAGVKSAAAAQISAVQQAFAAQVMGADGGAAGGRGAEAQLLAGDPAVDMPGLSQLLTEAVFQPGTVHRPETPRLIGAQLAQAFVAKGDRNVDVALNPEELGRVKMRVSTSESGITVVIQTERPETGDLMRRHINELADEFRKMGFENISFEFNGGGASGGQAKGDSDGQTSAGISGTRHSDDLTAAEVAETQVQHLRLGNAGVDMRV
ncbi:flagellar hook-length control protein FliK [Pseudophaeobacter flagellatus]|uniref:flagellar hook-length control protein FliK n=1 Tax=Pseudophaeobacter flagellatus TaxID=2899119 RepID=UPI001E4F638B|nr:flagellar hook-length control protein FliK [Pseudophaeobacter flagellatus]MCD9147133.1 flagellar hook-length control protein FliK [Pseudophaeobacter flagellatus]